MAYRMTKPEIEQFLAHGQRTAKVATTRPDGRPHVVPVWFVMAGDDLIFMTGSGTVKGRALARDPRLTIAVDLESTPYSFVMLEGTATLSGDVEAMLPWSIAIARRYVPLDQAEAFGRRNAVEGEVLVRVSPTRIVAFADLIG